MLFLLTGSAGSGKTVALAELARRRTDLILRDLDDLLPPREADTSWWRAQIQVHVEQARTAEVAGRDTVLAGWMTIKELRDLAGWAALEAVAACLLDCSEVVRRQRIEQRVASGTWRQHTSAEVAAFLDAAEEMRRQMETSTFRLDTSSLSVSEVVDEIERWMAESRRSLAEL